MDEFRPDSELNCFGSLSHVSLPRRVTPATPLVASRLNVEEVPTEDENWFDQIPEEPPAVDTERIDPLSLPLEVRRAKKALQERLYSRPEQSEVYKGLHQPPSFSRRQSQVLPADSQKSTYMYEHNLSSADH